MQPGAGDAGALQAAFEAIYREDRWSNGSGPGSHPDSTIEYRAFLARFMEANAVRTVTDLGCGDWQFSRYMDWSRADYLGLDVVPGVVARNQAQYGAAGVRFATFASLDDLPGGDLLLAKEVLQHLPNPIVQSYLDAIRKRYRHALITNAIEPAALANQEIAIGDWRPLRLEAPPFESPGAIMHIYFPQAGSHFWKNAVFYMPGDR